MSSNGTTFQSGSGTRDINYTNEHLLVSGAATSTLGLHGENSSSRGATQVDDGVHSSINLPTTPRPVSLLVMVMDQKYASPGLLGQGLQHAPKNLPHLRTRVFFLELHGSKRIHDNDIWLVKESLLHQKFWMCV